MAENCDTGFDPAEDSYRIRLNEFEGPLDLLLHLIKKDEINIYDIPIATITKQYLDYIKMMKSLNLVVAGEFLVMAATLIHIKSRMLLPVESDGDDEDETDEDPRAELVRRLLEYKRFKEAAGELVQRGQQWRGGLCPQPSVGGSGHGWRGDCGRGRLGLQRVHLGGRPRAGRQRGSPQTTDAVAAVRLPVTN